MAGGVTNLLNSSSAFLSSFKAAMDANSGSLSQSLSGLIKVMGKSLEAIEQTAAIKRSINLVKNSIDHEIDKYEANTNILNLNTAAKPLSLTSDKNASPGSVQIMLRTQEISVKNNDVMHEDTDNKNGNPFERIGKVFQKIWHAIISAFSQR